MINRIHEHFISNGTKIMYMPYQSRDFLVKKQVILMMIWFKKMLFARSGAMPISVIQTGVVIDVYG